MAAWDIRKFVLACDHFDTPDRDEIAAMLGSRDPLTINFDKPQRCFSRFEVGFMTPYASRSAVRKRAAKQGWVHVHEPGLPYAMDKDFCPQHAADATPAPAGTDLITGRFVQDDWLS